MIYLLGRWVQSSAKLIHFHAARSSHLKSHILILLLLCSLVSLGAMLLILHIPLTLSWLHAPTFNHLSTHRLSPLDYFYSYYDFLCSEPLHLRLNLLNPKRVGFVHIFSSYINFDCLVITNLPHPYLRLLRQTLNLLNTQLYFPQNLTFYCYYFEYDTQILRENQFTQYSLWENSYRSSRSIQNNLNLSLYKNFMKSYLKYFIIFAKSFIHLCLFHRFLLPLKLLLLFFIFIHSFKFSPYFNLSPYFKLYPYF